MSISPLPRRGGVSFDSRNEGRALRVSARSDEVVLSTWRGDSCVATHHVAVADVPDLIKLLATALVDAMPEGSARAS
jgi:hypothetical protein